MLLLMCYNYNQNNIISIISCVMSLHQLVATLIVRYRLMTKYILQYSPVVSHGLLSRFKEFFFAFNRSCKIKHHTRNLKAQTIWHSEHLNENCHYIV